MMKNLDRCSPERRAMSSNVQMFCPQPRDFQFTVKGAKKPKNIQISEAEIRQF